MMMNLKQILVNEKIDISELEKLMNSHVLVTITNLDGIILYANQNFLDLMEYSLNEVIGSDHSMFKSKTHSFVFYEKLWKTILSKNVWTGAILNKTKNGNKIWLKTTITPIINNGVITHFAAIRSNITENVKTTKTLSVAKESLKNHNLSLKTKLEQNKKQMRMQRLSAIGELASRMSHDIRNPLSVIRMSLENIVMLYGDRVESKKSFQRIDSAIDRIAHQIDDVLDFVREKKVEKEILILSEIIPEILSTIRLSTKINLNTSLQEIKIEFDRTMFYVIIKNLVMNAIQACENDGRIDIQTTEDDLSILIEIRDSGPGIPPESLKKIFEPLFTTKQQGTGLGLASCKSIIQQHGGTIYAKSNPTIFTVKLPKN